MGIIVPVYMNKREKRYLLFVFINIHKETLNLGSEYESQTLEGSQDK